MQLCCSKLDDTRRSSYKKLSLNIATDKFHPQKNHYSAEMETNTVWQPNKQLNRSTTTFKWNTFSLLDGGKGRGLKHGFLFLKPLNMLSSTFSCLEGSLEGCQVTMHVVGFHLHHDDINALGDTTPHEATQPGRTKLAETPQRAAWNSSSRIPSRPVRRPAEPAPQGRRGQRCQHRPDDGRRGPEEKLPWRDTFLIWPVKD